MTVSGFATSARMALDAVFAHFGRDAAWPGVAGVVRVLVNAADAVETFGRSQGVRATTVLTVRVADVARPCRGEQVVVLATPDAPEAVYRLSADPRHDPGDSFSLEWLCEAEPV